MDGRRRGGRGTAVLALFGALAVAATAQAQGLEQVFVNVNAGGQSKTQSFTTQDSFTLYDETASFTSDQSLGSGFLFDINGGLRFWRNLGVGVGFSRFADTSGATVVARIPHPLFFDRPREVATTVSDLEHMQTAVHVFGTWESPLPSARRVVIGVSGGVSFFSVDQDLVIDVTPLQPELPPFQAQIASTLVGTASDSATGFNAGIDINYMVSEQLGAGVFFRYAGATVDLTSSAGTVSLDLGGAQFGVGLRYRLPLR